MLSDGRKPPITACFAETNRTSVRLTASDGAERLMKCAAPTPTCHARETVSPIKSVPYTAEWKTTTSLAIAAPPELIDFSY